jgi:hypothetical protein
VSDAAVVMMLFDAVRLTNADPDAPAGRAKATNRRRRAKPTRPLAERN